jgi:hypothetical protein
MESKRVTLVVPGAGDAAEARDAEISPGVTAVEVLRAADMDPQEWQLQVKQGNGSISLSAQDDLYQRVQNGDKVFAVPKTMTVG